MVPVTACSSAGMESQSKYFHRINRKIRSHILLHLGEVCTLGDPHHCAHSSSSELSKYQRDKCLRESGAWEPKEPQNVLSVCDTDGGPPQTDRPGLSPLLAVQRSKCWICLWASVSSSIYWEYIDLPLRADSQTKRATTHRFYGHLTHAGSLFSKGLARLNWNQSPDLRDDHVSLKLMEFPLN